MSARLRVVLATRNAGKAREFDRLLAPALSVEALADAIAMPQETGMTFEENARLKAQSIFEELDGRTAVLADDSGLEVDALDGRPGVLSARFAGPDAADRDNVARLLSELTAGVDRSARFVCCLCLALPRDLAGAPDAGLVEVQGTLEGAIVEQPRGDDGFGYDPVFLPRGWSQTLAQASAEEKDSVSHRGAASRLLCTKLQPLVSGRRRGRRWKSMPSPRSSPTLWRGCPTNSLSALRTSRWM